MTYNIRMGIPEMAELWNRLQTSYREGTISKRMQNFIGKYETWQLRPIRDNLTGLLLCPNYKY